MCRASDSPPSIRTLIAGQRADGVVVARSGKVERLRNGWMTFEIVAHRGAQGETVDNIVASFQRALDLGADAVELDVRLTREGVPVVHHHFYVDQLTPGAFRSFYRPAAPTDYRFSATMML